VLIAGLGIFLALKPSWFLFFVWMAVVVVLILRRRFQHDLSFVMIASAFMEYHQFNLTVRTRWENIKSIEIQRARWIKLVFHQPSGTGTYSEGKQLRALRTQLELDIQHYEDNQQLLHDFQVHAPPSKRTV
jgi:hypothetical protein